MSKYGFIKFCEDNCDSIIKAISSAASHIPPKMNLPDYRFNINNLYCHALTKQFSLGGEGGTLRSSYGVGYDMMFADTDKISVKIQQEVFQRYKKNGIALMVAKDIIMKNCLGKASESKMDLDIDFLLAIQRGKEKSGKVFVGFGAISKHNLNKFIRVCDGDQFKAKIPNSDFEFFSGLQKVDVNADSGFKSELNKRFSEGLAKTYDRILST